MTLERSNNPISLPPFRKKRTVGMRDEEGGGIARGMGDGSETHNGQRVWMKGNGFLPIKDQGVKRG